MATHAATAEPEVHGHPALQHHFENMEQQREAGTLGMWVFLVTEDHVLRRDVSGLHALPIGIRRRLRQPAITSTSRSAQSTPPC